MTFSPDQWTADLGVDVFDETFRYRLEHRFIGLAWELLALGCTVVLEFGLWGRDERDLPRDEARSRGVSVELHLLEVPFEDQWSRVEARNVRGEHGTAQISRGELERYATLFQRPDVAELAAYDPPRMTLARRPGDGRIGVE